MLWEDEKEGQHRPWSSPLFPFKDLMSRFSSRLDFPARREGWGVRMGTLGQGLELPRWNRSLLRSKGRKMMEVSGDLDP